MVKKLIQGIVVGLAAAAVAVGFWLAGWLSGPENITWRWRVRFFARLNPPSDQIKIILLDQNSLDYGKNESHWSWPWPRQVYGPIFSFCKRGGAKAVAFDMLYTEPSAYEVADDELLGSAYHSVTSSVAAMFLGTKSGDATTWPSAVPTNRLVFEGLAPWLKTVHGGGVLAPRAAFPIPEVATNAAYLANVSDQPDDDGVFRRTALFQVFDGKPVPSLGLAAYLAAAANKEVKVEPGWLTIGSGRVPIDEGGRAILYFRGTNGMHSSFSAASIIQSELRLQEGGKPTVDPSVFKDSYVFFGTSAPGLLDLRPTAISKVYPGVEIHATALDNLLSALFLRHTPRKIAFVVTVLLAMFSGILVILSRKAWQSVVAFVVCLPIPVALGFAAYAKGFWWPVAVGEAATLLALVGGVVVNYATEGRQKAFIKSAFKHYLGPAVIDQIIADPSRLQLGGEKRELTIFFSDIEKFSSFSEKLEASVLTALLNEYLSEMGAIIQEEGGYLDKFIGDAIVAFWNAPLAQPDHAIRACRAMLRCQRRLAELRPQFQQKYGPVIKARIGMNTGEVTVGNMGSHDRFNYTVLGDAANLASRLEGANKAFGTYAMVSESTWTAMQGQIVGRELARIRVVGRQTPVTVYEPLGLAGEPLPPFAADFERGLKLCYEGQWVAAIEWFDKHPDDSPSRILADRCRKLLANPSETWDGIWNLTEK